MSEVPPSDREQAMKSMWEEGYSAREVALRVGGGVTRNVVVGLASRRGWNHGARLRPNGPAPGMPYDADIVRLWRANATVEAIAAALALSPVTVRKRAKKLGLARRARGFASGAGAPLPARGEGSGVGLGRRAAVSRLADARTSPHPSPLPARSRAQGGEAADVEDRAALARATREGRLGAPESVLALTLDACRWPVGDPLTENFAFCMEAAAEGAVYCAGHLMRARGTRMGWP